MSPKLALPSVALHCPRFPKSSDFIALDCPQFGNKIGDSCPGLPPVAQPIGDRIGDGDPSHAATRQMLASYHAGFSMLFGFSSIKPISSKAEVSVQKTASSSPQRLFNSGHGKEQAVGVIKQRYKLVVQVEGTGSGIQCVSDYPRRSNFRCVSPAPVQGVHQEKSPEPSAAGGTAD